MNGEKLATSLITGEFRDRDLEAEYSHSVRNVVAAHLRLAVIAAAVLFLLFAFNDYTDLGLSRPFWVLWAVRLVPVAGAVWLLIALRRHPELAVRGTAITLLEIIALTTFLVIVWVRPGAMPWHATAITTIVFALYVTVPNRPLLSLGVGIYAAVGFLLVGTIAAQLSVSHVGRYTLLLVMANAFGHFANLQLSRMRRREFALLYQERSARRDLEQEVERRRELEDDLKRLANTDSLTGLLNRRQYLSLSNHEARRSSRSERPLTVCLFDLDHFKRINDEHGHDAGDAVLKAIAQAVSETVREIDIVGRYGGEEFTVTLPDTNMQAAGEVAERIREAIAGREVIYHGKPIHATATLGLAAVRDGEKTVEAALARADAALYRGKAAGRNRIERETS